MTTLAEVPQVPTGHVALLTVVYLVAFLVCGGASGCFFWLMRRAAQAYDERSTVKLAVAAGATGLLAAIALILFVNAIGFIGRAIIGLAIASALILIGGNRARSHHGYRP
jgi:hypothetical protein